MSRCRSILINGFFSSVVTAGTMSGLAAASGASGAAILKAAGYSGYSVSVATKMGAIGGAIVGAGMGAVAGALKGSGLFKDSAANSIALMGEGVSYVGANVVSGLAGYGIMHLSKDTVMEVAKTAASFAVGGAVTAVPLACVALCICLPIAYYLTVKNQEEAEAESQAEAKVEAVDPEEMELGYKSGLQV